jgi:hypothetical protein
MDHNMICFDSLPVYDRQVHITAGELRALGFYLQENLADEAFVRREAVGLSPRETFDDGSPTVRLELLEEFTAPLQAFVI